MAKFLIAINALGAVDIAFLVICVAIVAIIIGVYFLIPVINKKQYQEQRDNLRKREDAFRTNYAPGSAGVAYFEDENGAEMQNQVQEKVVDKQLLVMKIIVAVSFALRAVLIIPLMWCLPILRTVWKNLKYDEPIDLSVKICTLLFLSVPCGIMMFVRKKDVAKEETAK